MTFHWARLIELLHCTEAIAELLCDPDLIGTEMRNMGELQPYGTGVIEPPRAYLLTIRAYEFGLGKAMTEQAKANLQKAYRYIIKNDRLDSVTGIKLPTPR